MPRLRTLRCSACALAFVVAVCIEVLPSAATAQGQGATQRVIVVLKNQETSLPPTRSHVAARKRAIQGVQAPIERQLSSSAARNIHSYDVINAVSATVSKNEESQLKSNPAVSEVVPDQIIQLAPAQTSGTSASGAGATPLRGACAAPGKVQLNPQALQTIRADSDNAQARTARSLGFDGSGVTVAFIADGLDINNPDFIRDGKSVFLDYKDFSGEGTGVPTGGEEAFGDASSIAAQGHEVYDVSHYDDLPLNRPCDIRVEGVAPGANLVGLDIFGAEDAGFNSSFLQAIDYAVSVDHVQVLNESLGNNYYPDDQASLDLIKRANDEAVAAGTTVTVSSGDAGVTSTIGTPSTDPAVISAGATTTYRLDAQDGYGGARFPGVTGWLNNNISSFSSGGFEQSGRTVDLVAPGELNWAVCSTNTQMYSECLDPAGTALGVVQFGGTSESAPLTAGVAALVIQAYRKTHGGASPTPAVVKQIITSTADDIGSPAEQQGTGLIDAYKAVVAAESYRAPASSQTGATLLTSADQLNAIDSPGTPEALTDKVTNNSSRSETVSVGTRTVGSYQTVKTATVQLSDTGSLHIVDWNGVTDNYEPVTFNVPQGENRLSASMAFQNASPTDLNARVRLTLVDSAGHLAAYSVPQGDGNYGNVQVTNPRPGKWTAYIYSRNSSAGGTTGPVVFAASVAKYAPFGHASPATLTLAPGQTGLVTLRVSTPGQPGDTSGAVILSTKAGAGSASVTTIPVTLRSLIPGGSQSFTSTLTGGNGREFITGETFYYQLDVPSGRSELNATVKLANNPNNPFSAWLVSPSGEALAFSSNDLPNTFSATPTEVTNEIGAQLHVLSPPPGRWTLIVLFAPAVSGTAISEPFTVTTNQTAIQATAAGWPDSPKLTVPAGQAHTYDVRVHNGGPAPEAYFIDARQPASTSLNLDAFTSPDTTEPLTVNANIPEYLVPTHTTAFVEQASTTGPQPILFDSESPAGDPDIGSTAGTSASASFSANPLSQGLWEIAPVEVGPFGSAPGPSEPVTTSMQVTTDAFDSAVSSPTGDLWLASGDQTQLAKFDPVIVQPGQTATIPVTITPTGTSGTTVTGTLYVDDANFILYQVLASANGNEVAALPYSYTVK